MRLLPIVAGAGFTAATAWALGRILLARLRVRLYREDEHLLAFIAGSVTLSMVMFVLACCKLVYTPVLIAIGTAAVFAAWREGAFSRSEERLPALPRLWRWFFWAVYVPFGVVALAFALAPEISPDGSSYHLGIVSRYLREHGFIPMPWHMYAQLSQGFDLLYLFAFALGRHSAAATYHLLFLMTLPWLIVRYGQRAGYPAAGVAAGLFTFVAPVVQNVGAVAYNDVALATIIFTLFYVFEASRDEWADGVPALTGLLAGFCYGIKYTAFVAAPYALVRLLLQLRAQKRLSLRPVAVFCVCAGLMIVPWMVRNQLWYSNPFAPLMNRLVPNPTNHVSFEDGYSKFMRTYDGIESYMQIPMELTVRGQKLGGIVGPLFLLSPLALFAARTAPGWRILLAALVFASTYPLNIGTRFVIPALPFISLALALALPAWRVLLPLLVVAHSVTSWYRMIPVIGAPYAPHIEKFLWKQAWSPLRAQEWLNAAPNYRAAQLVERHTPPDAVVLTYNALAEAYTSRDTRVWFQSAWGDRMFDLLWVAWNLEAQPIRGERFTFPRQPLRKLRVIQTESHEDLQWSLSEIRVHDGANELPRLPLWRLTAKPSPWDVQYAFDNSPLTRWRSWRRLEPGMYVEIDLGQATTASDVTVELSNDQWSIKMRLEGMGDDGQWRVLASASTQFSLPPQLEMRRAATDELKRGGVTHILVRDDDFGSADMRQNEDLWGFTVVGETDGWRLYKLE